MGQHKKRTGTFKDYYRFPLMIDEYCGNVIAQEDKSGYMMAFDWIGNEYISEYPIGSERGAELANNIVKFLNDETDTCPKFVWSTDTEKDPTIIYINGMPCMQIRGWGNLNSPNCWGLHHTTAAKVQDEFRDWIVNKLNSVV